MISKKKLIIAILITVLISVSIYIVFIPGDKSDEPGTVIDINETEEDNINVSDFQEYEGISMNDNTVEINSEILIQEHLKKYNALDSYRMIVNSESGNSTVLRKYGNKSKIHIKNIDSLDKEIYYDGNYTYNRTGSAATSLFYSKSSSSINYSSYYPSDNMKTILDNTTVDSVDESGNKLVIKLKSENEDSLESFHTVTEITDYSVDIHIHKNGLIDKFYVQIRGTENIRGNYKEFEISYNIDNNGINSVVEPGWLQKAENTE